MSRGGRNGHAGTRAGTRTQNLPFEVDAELEDQIAQYRDKNGDDEDDWTKTLYPTVPIYLAPPPTAEEKKLVNKWREHRTAMRNGPFFIGSAKVGKRDLTDFNAFEDVQTYSNKRLRPLNRLPNLKKVPIIKELMPKELWDVISNEGTVDVTNPPQKDLAFLKKKTRDKLAQFDEGADLIDPAADLHDENVDGENEDGEDGVDVPRDDDFDEADDDADNDYNAEMYFDDGDDDDDHGGEEGGGGRGEAEDGEFLD